MSELERGVMSDSERPLIAEDEIYFEKGKDWCDWMNR